MAAYIINTLQDWVDWNPLVDKNVVLSTNVIIPSTGLSGYTYSKNLNGVTLDGMGYSIIFNGVVNPSIGLFWDSNVIYDTNNFTLKNITFDFNGNSFGAGSNMAFLFGTGGLTGIIENIKFINVPIINNVTQPPILISHQVTGGDLVVNNVYASGYFACLFNFVRNDAKITINNSVFVTPSFLNNGTAGTSATTVIITDKDSGAVLPDKYTRFNNCIMYATNASINVSEARRISFSDSGRSLFENCYVIKDSNDFQYCKVGFLYTMRGPNLNGVPTFKNCFAKIGNPFSDPFYYNALGGADVITYVSFVNCATNNGSLFPTISPPPSPPPPAPVIINSVSGYNYLGNTTQIPFNATEYQDTDIWLGANSTSVIGAPRLTAFTTNPWVGANYTVFTQLPNMTTTSMRTIPITPPYSTSIFSVSGRIVPGQRFYIYGQIPSQVVYANDYIDSTAVAMALTGGDNGNLTPVFASPVNQGIYGDYNEFIVENPDNGILHIRNVQSGKYLNITPTPHRLVLEDDPETNFVESPYQQYLYSGYWKNINAMDIDNPTQAVSVDVIIARSAVFFNASSPPTSNGIYLTDNVSTVRAGYSTQNLYLTFVPVDIHQFGEDVFDGSVALTNWVTTPSSVPTSFNTWSTPGTGLNVYYTNPQDAIIQWFAGWNPDGECGSGYAPCTTGQCVSKNSTYPSGTGTPTPFACSELLYPQGETGFTGPRGVDNFTPGPAGPAGPAGPSGNNISWSSTGMVILYILLAVMVIFLIWALIRLGFKSAYFWPRTVNDGLVVN